MKSLKVNLDKKTVSSYDIRIGAGITDRIVLLIAKTFKASHYVVVTDSNVKRLHAPALIDAMTQAGLNVSLIDFPAGESQKTLDTAVEVVGKLLALGADRSTVLIALGGGVVGDLTGFVASVYMRSIPYVQVPTTLVGQVDSAVGGKTAVDLAQGKNLVGAFYQPKAVYADVKYLETLPDAEFRNGLAEIIKYGIIEDTALFGKLEARIDDVGGKDTAFLTGVVEACLRIKKSIVEIDEHEQGLRRILNYGHTLGHALEAVSGYRLSHGEGVALGMIAAARLSEKMHYLPAQETRRIEALVERAGLPVRIPADFAAPEILARLKMDKKKKDGAVRFVLLKKIGMPFVNGGLPEEMITDVIEGMKA
ncbi:MAG TPA: 3-dehydroquinate synthase [Smithellaceae bacterium]|nr:3-dehydroquinate synthase [Smithellaceae bacterium]